MGSCEDVKIFKEVWIFWEKLWKIKKGLIYEDLKALRSNIYSWQFISKKCFVSLIYKYVIGYALGMFSLWENSMECSPLRKTWEDANLNMITVDNACQRKKRLFIVRRRRDFEFFDKNNID